jgi:hypothetical protein
MPVKTNADGHYLTILESPRKNPPITAGLASYPAHNGDIRIELCVDRPYAAHRSKLS